MLHLLHTTIIHEIKLLTLQKQGIENISMFEGSLTPTSPTITNEKTHSLQTHSLRTIEQAWPECILYQKHLSNQMLVSCHWLKKSIENHNKKMLITRSKYQPNKDQRAWGEFHMYIEFSSCVLQHVTELQFLYISTLCNYIKYVSGLLSIQDILTWICRSPTPGNGQDNSNISR